MKKTTLALTFLALFSATTQANVETFDTRESAAANGFILDPWIMFIDPGRPFLEDISRSHAITYSPGTFTFNSMEFNAFPAANIDVVEGFILNMALKGISGETLLNTSITLNPDRTWTNYSNTVPNVHSIYFPALIFATFPSFDNLHYTTGNQGSVPEPGTLFLFGAGIIGAIGVKALKKIRLAIARK